MRFGRNQPRSQPIVRVARFEAVSLCVYPATRLLQGPPSPSTAVDWFRATTPCRGPGLDSDSSAVYVDFRTCDVGRFIGSEEQNGVGHLVNLSRAAHRNDAHAFGPHGRLGQEFLDVTITQREAQVHPDRILDDRRRKAVAAVGDFSQRSSLSAVSPTSYPGYPDKAPSLRNHATTSTR